MEENSKKQYAILPTIEGISDLTPQDQLVYLGIKSFMNKDTLQCYPSQKTIGDRIGCCDKTVRKSIKNLVDKKYIKVIKNGKGTIYEFDKVRQFEPFSYAFIEDKNMSFTQKSLLAASQRYMKDKNSGTGKIQYSKMELAEKINMPYPTLVKATRELTEKNIMSTVQNEMQFHFARYFQDIVTTLINHEDRIEENSRKINETEEKADLIIEFLKYKFGAENLKEELEDFKKSKQILL